MDEDRRSLYARISTESHDAWCDYADQHGVTLTALVQAVGEHLGTGTDPFSKIEEQKVVNRARQIARERATRRR